MGAQDHPERSAVDPLVIDTLRLFRAFQTIADAADRRKVIELAVALARGPDRSPPVAPG
jgi:hypothetical protein